MSSAGMEATEEEMEEFLDDEEAVADDDIGFS